MDDREVINILNDMKGVFGERTHNQYSLYAIDRAIEILEKQIPKKPLNQRVRNEELIGSCPTCKLKWNVGYWEKHCSNCGQKTDWS